MGHDSMTATKIKIALIFGILSEIKNDKLLINVSKDIIKQTKKANWSPEFKILLSLRFGEKNCQC